MVTSKKARSIRRLWVGGSSGRYGLVRLRRSGRTDYLSQSGMSLQPAVRDSKTFSVTGPLAKTVPGKRKDELYPRLVPRMRDGEYRLAFIINRPAIAGGIYNKTTNK